MEEEKRKELEKDFWTQFSGVLNKIEEVMPSIAREFKPHPVGHAFVTFGAYVSSLHSDSESEIELISNTLRSALDQGLERGEEAKKLRGEQ